MITVNAMGDACPIPVVKTKNAIASLKGADVVETLVDNEIAVENLKKMADQKGYKTTSEKLEEGNIVCASSWKTWWITLKKKTETVENSVTVRRKKRAIRWL